jgi:hypothetical protein
MVFATTRRFRINANKNRLDVWLIYQCQKCRHTLNIPLYERVPPQKIPAELYERLLANDEASKVLVQFLQVSMNMKLKKSMHHLEAEK